MNTSLVQLQLSVLAEPNRFKIVELLRRGRNTVSGIVEELHMGQPWGERIDNVDALVVDLQKEEEHE